MASHIYSTAIASIVAGQFCVSVQHWQTDDAGFATSQQCATAINNAWVAAKKTAWRACHPTDSILLSLTTTRVTGGGGFKSVGFFTGSNAGTRTGATSASGLAPCFIINGVLNSKKRGRLFLHGVSEADVIDGVFTAAYRTAVNTNMDTVFDSMTLTGGGGLGCDSVIYDRVHKTAVLTDTHALSDMLGTIRRRQRPT